MSSPKSAISAVRDFLLSTAGRSCTVTSGQTNIYLGHWSVQESPTWPEAQAVRMSDVLDVLTAARGCLSEQTSNAVVFLVWTFIKPITQFT